MFILLWQYLSHQEWCVFTPHTNFILLLQICEKHLFPQSTCCYVQRQASRRFLPLSQGSHLCPSFPEPSPTTTHISSSLQMRSPHGGSGVPGSSHLFPLYPGRHWHLNSRNYINYSGRGGHTISHYTTHTPISNETPLFSIITSVNIIRNGIRLEQEGF